VFKFSNPYALNMAGQNFYTPSASSGVMSLSEAQVIPGTLERSGVELAKEMVNMIRTQRAYQLSIRTITIADEVEQTTNTLRA